MRDDNDANHAIIPLDIFDQKNWSNSITFQFSVPKWHLPTRLYEGFTQNFRHGNWSMLPASAAKTDGQVAFTFFDIGW